MPRAFPVAYNANNALIKKPFVSHKRLRRLPRRDTCRTHAAGSAVKIIREDLVKILPSPQAQAANFWPPPGPETANTPGASQQFQAQRPASPQHLNLLVSGVELLASPSATPQRITGVEEGNEAEHSAGKSPISEVGRWSRSFKSGALAIPSPHQAVCLLGSLLRR
ncbi:hypothetical protein VCV18_007061 [Metarhizium anisopliae]